MVRTLRLGPRTLAYDDLGADAGAAAPLVLLHAFPFDRRMWTDAIAALGPGLRLLAPDLRGFGASELGATGFSIADLADDVAALLDACGLERATIAGLSMGGYVALAFAARHPDRLAALALCDTKAGPDAPEARKGRDEAIALVRAEGVAPFADRQLPRLLAADAAPELRRRVRPLMDQPADGVAAALAALRDRPDRRPELGAIRCPTLVIVGSEDALTPPAEAAALAAGVPGARLVEIAGAGHLPNLEAPTRFAEALGGFARRPAG
jgi:3-oxoadipate enol-lactonase